MRAPVVLWSTLRTPSTKNPVPVIAVHDAVVGEPEAVEVVGVQVEESAAANLARPIDLVLIGGDVQPVVVQEHPVIR